MVNDYGKKYGHAILRYSHGIPHRSRLLAAIVASQSVMEQSASHLLLGRGAPPLVVSEAFDSWESLPRQRLLSFNHSRRIVFVYNPTDGQRRDIVRILIDRHQVRVTSDGQTIRACQIDPAWTHRRSNSIERDQFEVRANAYDSSDPSTRVLSCSFASTFTRTRSKHTRFI